MTIRNWAGNVAFKPATFQQPRTQEELQSAVARSDRCRVIGTGHSFSPLVVTDHDLISLALLPPLIQIDRDRLEVRVGASIRYGELSATLHANGFALANLGSLPHISVAGACSTGTHGSGSGNGCLATAVRCIELVAASGEIISVSPESHPDTFNGHVVNLGSLGVLLTLTLAIEPTYFVSQVVYDSMDFEVAFESLDEILAGGYSVSLFTSWSGAHFDQVWRKFRADGADRQQDDWFGARRAVVARHPVPGMAPDVCTEQLDVVGPWHERLPHFRLDFKPSVGEELQSEYLIDRADAPMALRLLQSISAHIRSVLQTCEIRSVAHDELWLSPAYNRESVAIHFTWTPDVAAVRDVLSQIEGLLTPFAPRPHWGKVFNLNEHTIAATYPRFNDAVALAQYYDPTGKFVNAFTSQYLTSQHPPRKLTP